MLLHHLALAGLAQSWHVTAAPHQHLADAVRSTHLAARSSGDKPSDSYAPTVVPCPAKQPEIRRADGLSPDETAWLKLRRKATVAPMIDFLKGVTLTGFDAEKYINEVAASDDMSKLPNVAIAMSGGGYRALMNGAGFLAAADSRTKGALDKGGIGGLLQSTTYLSALSGGSWLVSSMFANNYSSVERLQDGFPESSVWKFRNSIFKGPETGGIDVINAADYWLDIVKQVDQKNDAGFETSITDYWGRALSYQLIHAPHGGPAMTFSSIAQGDAFSKGESPMPILVANGREPGVKLIDLNTTNFEFNPFEMGSYDPTLNGFVRTEWLGTDFREGLVPAGGKCVRGYDSMSFVLGTSSSLFNQFALQIHKQSSLPEVVKKVIKKLLDNVGDDNNDIAVYRPNPFYKWSAAKSRATSDERLTLVDGGEDNQNIPLTPLLLPARNVDVIFAIDSTADTTFSWPNGSALRHTYDRSLSPISNGILAPPVPDVNTFINSKLNRRPTFFGCDFMNFSLKVDQPVPPLLVYLPNAPYTSWSNVSTFDPNYSDRHRNDIIRNGYNAATQGNGTVDAQWPTCVRCALLIRSLSRTLRPVPKECHDCFKRYCWDGKLSPTPPPPEYNPTFIISDQTTPKPAKGAAA